ncbi:MAG: hypothetical protein KY475_19895 [Planctomycetes bacterium]|nr:hypothetical protein [Planctomycetota bacterium]
MIACSLALVLYAVAGPTAAGGSDEAASQKEMEQKRKKAAHRQRRVIFNNDGNEAVYFPADREPTPENVLALRTAPLVDSHMDTIFYCTNRAFGMCLHKTKLGEILTSETREKQGYYADKRNIVGELINQGTDPLRIMVDFAREHKKEIFWSMRMNDIHDATNSSLLPQFKKLHPEYLFGTPKHPPPYKGFSGAWGSESGAAWGGYSGVDYAQEEVREHAFRLIEEVCRGYDVDGVELDFFRSPVLFKSHAWDKPVTREERDALTDLLRRVRGMTEEVSLHRGRPLLIAIRAPDSVEYCHAIGIDLERWLQEGLVDLLAVGGDFVLSPWEESVALGHKHGVPVYPVLTNTARHPIPEFRTRSNSHGYRARAMNAWQAGADGVYLFNLFDPSAPMWRELGDPESLRSLDKVYYAVSGPLEQVTRYQRNGLRFCRLATLSPEYPEALNPGEPLTTTLIVGENVLWSKREGVAPDLKLGVCVQDLDDPEDIRVTLNGHALQGGLVVTDWLEYEPKPEWVRQGSNDVEIHLDSGVDAAPVVRDLRLRVAYEN